MTSISPLESPNNYQAYTPVLVIGGGLSGVLTALELATQGIKVTLVIQKSIQVSSSYYAQGGIAAVMPDNTEDSLISHIEDTLSAGAGRCNPAAVRSIVEGASELVYRLEHYGVRWDKASDGKGYTYGQEGSHACRRILHVSGDATGKGIMDGLHTALIKAIASGTIHLLEGYTLVSLLQSKVHAPIEGAIFIKHASHTLNIPSEQWRIQADYTVLATGGYARLWRYATPPLCNIGEGLMLAQQAGATMTDLPFVQFHPTAFAYQGDVKGLISEALRGEGGRLKNAKGEYFMPHYHPLADLAPRDVVSRAIFQEYQKHTERTPEGVTPEPITLDMTHLPESFLKQRFPSIYAKCMKAGINMSCTPIPVTPAAHYSMGGIACHYQTGESALARLYIVGEASYTGLHGANRLASNSLLECGVMAQRVAHHLAHQGFSTKQPHTQRIQTPSLEAKVYEDYRQSLPRLLPIIGQDLWQHMGVLRTQEGMKTLQEKYRTALDTAPHTEMSSHASQSLKIPSLSTQSMYHFLTTLATQALELPSSQGAHTLATSGHRENVSYQSCQ
ncbi:MAG: L-aspartate oxidase [Vampirovibrionales bacterium]